MLVQASENFFARSNYTIINGFSWHVEIHASFIYYVIVIGFKKFEQKPVINKPNNCSSQMSGGQVSEACNRIGKRLLRMKMNCK
jgi:hypothetical protein